MKVNRFAKNECGRDFIVGDIHGCFSKLSEHLDAIGFKPSIGDRLFSVGDIVDRGPESDDAMKWIDFPWFFPVRGNHEDMAIRWPSGRMNAENYIANGGSWNAFKSTDESLAISDAFIQLPIAIELETENGLVGIVHADCPTESWSEFISLLEDSEQSNTRRNNLLETAIWSRRRIELSQIGYLSGEVKGVRAVVVGHTPLPAPIVIGNVHHIDTGGWHANGHGFTIIDAENLLPVDMDC